MTKTENQIELDLKLLGLKYTYRSDIHSGYECFRAKNKPLEFTDIATRHGLTREVRRRFVGEVLGRCIFDGGRLSELTLPPELDWKVHTQKELALMENLTPVLRKLAQGREITGFAAYEEGR